MYFCELMWFKSIFLSLNYLIMKTQLSFLFLFFLMQNTLTAQQPLVAISDQMNVLYIGIPNPITVAVENFPSEHVMVSSDDVEVIPLGKGQYNIKPTQPGNVKIKVQPRGKDTQEIIYRVKRIPDPISKIGFNSGGNISVSQLKFHKGVIAQTAGFDLGKCVVSKYEMTIQYKSSGADPVSIINQGGKFTPETISLIETMDEGDTVYFDRINCKCPGDKASRKINAMIFKIRK